MIWTSIRQRATSGSKTRLVEAIESPNLIPAVVLEASPTLVRVATQGGQAIEIKADGLKFVAPSLSPKAQPGRKIVPGAVVRIVTQREVRMGNQPTAAGRGGLRRRQFARRRGPRAGRRVRLQPEQVQPRDAGLAAAGIELQAVHLLGGAREGFHSEHADQRRTHVHRSAPDRRPGLGAEELRRQVRGPDAAAPGPCQVEEPRLDPGAAGDRTALMRRTGRRTSGSRPTSIRPI